MTDFRALKKAAMSGAGKAPAKLPNLVSNPTPGQSHAVATGGQAMPADFEQQQQKAEQAQQQQQQAQQEQQKLEQQNQQAQRDQQKIQQQNQKLQLDAHKTQMESMKAQAELASAKAQQQSYVPPPVLGHVSKGVDKIRRKLQKVTMKLAAEPWVDPRPRTGKNLGPKPSWNSVYQPALQQAQADNIYQQPWASGVLSETGEALANPSQQLKTVYKPGQFTADSLDNFNRAGSAAEAAAKQYGEGSVGHLGTKVLGYGAAGLGALNSLHGDVGISGTVNHVVDPASHAVQSVGEAIGNLPSAIGSTYSQIREKGLSASVKELAKPWWQGVIKPTGQALWNGSYAAMNTAAPVMVPVMGAVDTFLGENSALKPKLDQAVATVKNQVLPPPAAPVEQPTPAAPAEPEGPGLWDQLMAAGLPVAEALKAWSSDFLSKLQGITNPSETALPSQNQGHEYAYSARAIQ